MYLPGRLCAAVALTLSVLGSANPRPYPPPHFPPSGNPPPSYQQHRQHPPPRPYGSPQPPSPHHLPTYLGPTGPTGPKGPKGLSGPTNGERSYQHDPAQYHGRRTVDILPEYRKPQSDRRYSPSYNARTHSTPSPSPSYNARTHSTPSPKHKGFSKTAVPDPAAPDFSNTFNWGIKMKNISEWFMLSGYGALLPDFSVMHPDDPIKQTEFILENLKEYIEDNDYGLNDIIRMDWTFVDDKVDQSNFEEIMGMWADYLKDVDVKPTAGTLRYVNRLAVPTMVVEYEVWLAK